MSEVTRITLGESLSELETLEDFPQIHAAESVGVDLLAATLDEIKILQKPWPSMSKSEQNEVIDRLRERVKDNVQRAVALIAAENRVTVVAKLDAVTFKRGIQATISLSKSNIHRLDLADNVGEQVLVCIMPSDQFTGDMDNLQGEDDQRSLPDDEQFAPEEDPLYREGVAFVRKSQRASISAVQRQLKIGYNRAARMVERMEVEGVVTAMNSNGSREVIGQ